MKCKNCSRIIEDDSIFCRFCGTKVLKERKKKAELTVPKAKQLDSGAWHIKMMIDGKMTYITEPTERECTAKARAIKAGLIKAEHKKTAITLKKACEDYIAQRKAVLSPSTINGYDAIARTRFQAYMSDDIHAIAWQQLISAECSVCSAKTVKNAWGFISSAVKSKGIELPDITLPQVIKQDLAWLDYTQIQTFLVAIKGKPCEMAALFALHGLRRSELLALTPEKIDLKGERIHIEGAVVRGIDNTMTAKDTNKNQSSRRTVPIMIPRLLELLNAYDGDRDKPYIKTNPNSLHGQINGICEKHGLPLVGVHGLRRSFASLAYHLGWDEMTTMRVGGWSDPGVMKEVYTKLADADLETRTDKMKEFYGGKTIKKAKKKQTKKSASLDMKLDMPAKSPVFSTGLAVS